MMSSDERFLYSRRAIVGAGSIGVVAAAAPAFAQNSNEAPLSKGGETPEALQDPRTKHPKPPFRLQEQPWPGVASRMDPRPDHGETSYRGSGRLAWPEGFDHRRRFRDGSRGRDRLCARGRRRGDQPSAG
jgi:hypothetical protein